MNMNTKKNVIKCKKRNNKKIFVNYKKKEEQRNQELAQKYDSRGKKKRRMIVPWEGNQGYR